MSAQHIDPSSVANDLNALGHTVLCDGFVPIDGQLRALPRPALFKPGDSTNNRTMPEPSMVSNDQQSGTRRVPSINFKRSVRAFPVQTIYLFDS